jgi:hypothetical protein
MDGLDKYAAWVRQHPDNARRVEDAARLLSFIVPVRTDVAGASSHVVTP